MYKFDENQAAAGVQKRELYASFGGLLMRIKGDATNLNEIDVDMSLYLLIRRA